MKCLPVAFSLQSAAYGCLNGCSRLFSSYAAKDPVDSNEKCYTLIATNTEAIPLLPLCRVDPLNIDKGLSLFEILAALQKRPNILLNVGCSLFSAKPMKLFLCPHNTNDWVVEPVR